MPDTDTIIAKDLPVLDSSSASGGPGQGSGAVNAQTDKVADIYDPATTTITSSDDTDTTVTIDSGTETAEKTAEKVVTEKLVENMNVDMSSKVISETTNDSAVKEAAEDLVVKKQAVATVEDAVKEMKTEKQIKTEKVEEVLQEIRVNAEKKSAKMEVIQAKGGDASEEDREEHRALEDETVTLEQKLASTKEEEADATEAVAKVEEAKEEAVKEEAKATEKLDKAATAVVKKLEGKQEDAPSLDDALAPMLTQEELLDVLRSAECKGTIEVQGRKYLTICDKVEEKDEDGNMVKKCPATFDRDHCQIVVGHTLEVNDLLDGATMTLLE